MNSSRLVAILLIFCFIIFFFLLVAITLVQFPDYDQDYDGGQDATRRLLILPRMPYAYESTDDDDTVPLVRSGTTKNK